MKYKIVKSSPYQDWLNKQPLKEQFQIEKRISQIEHEGYFGENKLLGNDLLELKWSGGRRIYYTVHENVIVLLLFGGNKNGQTQDINQARKILKKYLEASQKK